MDVKCPGCYRFTHYQQTDCHTLKANSQPTNWLQDLHLAFIGVTIIEFSRTPLCWLTWLIDIMLITASNFSSKPFSSGWPLCSATPRQLLCAPGVPQFFASPLEARQGLPPYLCIWKIVTFLEHLNLSLYSLSLIQMPFCVSVFPLRRRQRQKRLKLVGLTGESGSETQFHIAKLAFAQFEMFLYAEAYDFFNWYPLPHFKPSLMQAYWGLQLQKEAALRIFTKTRHHSNAQIKNVYFIFIG